MSKNRNPDLTKLPKWAHEYIRDITRERDEAVSRLDEYTDSQTKAPFYVDELECIRDGNTSARRRTRYFQTHKMSVSHIGIEMGIILRDDCIDIQWGREDRHFLGEVSMQPAAHNKIYLKVPDGEEK